MIDEDLDVALEQQAREERTSKAALIRRYVRERFEPLPPLEEDPLSGMIGAYEGQPATDIDEVVYGGHYRDRP
jgi:hypothetical protein